MPPPRPTLCLNATPEGPCLKLSAHRGVHSPRPAVWGGITDDPEQRTRKKIVKAGFATPRGGAKGGYQNHVSRSSRVIIPWEHASKVDFRNYEQGATVRVTAPQAVDLIHRGLLNDFEDRLTVSVGDDEWPAFILYRSSADRGALPFESHWQPCYHVVNGVEVNRRSSAGTDLGHYLERVPKQTPSGLPQGIFAPEYTGRVENYASQVLLTHLAYKTEGHGQDPNGAHVAAILEHLGLYDEALWLRNGAIDGHGTTACPLCARPIGSEELHETIDPSQVPGLANSGVQLAETRSTLVNLYHLRPLLYATSLGHGPTNIAWGHAHCNTFLAQRRSYSLAELQDGQFHPDVNLFWDESETFIRSEDGRAWVSVTPVSPGTETFTSHLYALGLQQAIDVEHADDDDS